MCKRVKLASLVRERSFTGAVIMVEDSHSVLHFFGDIVTEASLVIMTMKVARDSKDRAQSEIYRSLTHGHWA